jgi:hypothetical protein
VRISSPSRLCPDDLISIAYAHWNPSRILVRQPRFLTILSWRSPKIVIEKYLDRRIGTMRIHLCFQATPPRLPLLLSREGSMQITCSLLPLLEGGINAFIMLANRDILHFFLLARRKETKKLRVALIGLCLMMISVAWMAWGWV